MSFSLINPTGWSTGDLLTEDQINQLDQDHAQAVDSSGGLYFLSSPLTFSGDDVNIVGTFNVTGDIEVSDDINCDGNGNFAIGLNVNDNFFVDSIGQTISNGLIIANAGILTSLSGTTEINNPTTCEDIHVNGTFEVDGAGQAIFSGPAQFYGNVTTDSVGSTQIGNPAYFYGTANFLGAVTLDADVTVANGSCIIRRVYYLNAANLPASQNVENYDEVLITSAYNGGGIWTWSDSAAPNGKKMIFVTQSSSAPATIAIGGFGFVLRNTTGTTSGLTNYKRVEIVKIAGSWIVFDSVAA